MNTRYLLTALLAALTLNVMPVQAGRARIDSLFERCMAPFAFLPEYYLTLDVGVYALQKNSFFETRKFVSTTSELEFVLLSIADRVFSVWEFDVHYGLGRTPGNVVFDPMDVDFRIVPAFEVRFAPLFLQTGIEHHCFHEIDRKDFATSYWNKPFIGVGTPNMRLFTYWNAMRQPDGWTWPNRFALSATWGFFLKDFFGLVSPGKLNDENQRIHEANLQGRFAFYRRKSWIFNLYGATRLGAWEEESSRRAYLYWRQDSGLEFNFRRGNRGAMFYLYYTRDDIPLYRRLDRFSEDRLLRWGVKFFG